MNKQVEQILSNASNLQLDWIAARVHTKTDTEASKIVGIHPKTPITKWENKPDLDMAVHLLKREAVEGTIYALEHLALEAVHALGEALKDKRYRVQAAKEILSRVVPEKQEIKTSLSIDGAFEEALDRAYGNIEVLDEPPTIPENGKASRMPSRSG